MITQPDLDLRNSERLPIQRELRYKLLNSKSGDESGIGQTINISSTGVLIQTDNVLLRGRKIELSISWPAELNAKCGLRFVVRGRVVRADREKAAIKIDHYEFKTVAKVVTPIK